MKISNATRQCVTVIVSCLVLLAHAASAQTISSGSIAGVVRDASGAVLPGVTVEASSSALIEKTRTVITDEQGVYRIVDLRPGEYRVTFSLAGFSTLTREGIELSTSFTATVNADLRVGAVEETVTVSGAAPIVDSRNVMQQKTFARETLDALPTGKNMGQYAALIPGAVIAATAQDVGGITGEQVGGSFSIHGNRAADINVYSDGMLFNSLVAGGTTHWSFNRAFTEEVTVQTGGISAESAFGGPQVNMVPKEGGNSFSGYFGINGTSNKMQNGNLTDELRGRGLTVTPSVKKLYDVSFAAGGPIRRDRLWFFTAHRWWGAEQYGPGNYFNATQSSLFYTADLSRPAFTEESFQDNSVRLTWQASQKNKLNVTYQIQHNCSCFQGVLTANAAPEAVGRTVYSPNYATGVSWSYPMTNRILLEAGATTNIVRLGPEPQEGVQPDHIQVTELSTGYRYRSRATALNTGGSYGPHDSNQANQRFSMLYVTGSHSFKTGMWMQESWRHFQNEILGGMDYSFRNQVPASIRLWAQPHEERSRMRSAALYAQDQWSIQRLTLNLGLRYDYLTASFPEQDLPAGALVPARSFPAVKDVLNWKDLAPRIGGAYDVGGSGKTVVKAFVGRYVAFESVNGFSSATNPVNTMVNSATRTWNDLNGNFVPDCNLTLAAAQPECGPLSPNTFGQTRITTKYADDVVHGFRNRGSSWQASASFQHELRTGLALDVGYFRTWYNNQTVTDNLAVTSADFDPYCITAPVDPRLPGGGGNQLCGLYDIKPALFGVTDNLVTQMSHYGKQTEVFNGVDVTLQARFGAGRLLAGGLSTGRNVLDNCVVVDSPQAARPDFCKIAPPWSAGTQVKFLAVYPLIWDIQASGTYQNIPGIPIVASHVVPSSQIQPSLGRPLAAGPTATATIDLIPANTVFEDRIQQIDLRMTRNFHFGRTRIQGNFDIYNLFNASPVLTTNTRYGTQWLTATQILQGRLFKLGAQVNF